MEWNNIRSLKSRKGLDVDVYYPHDKTVNKGFFKLWSRLQVGYNWSAVGRRGLDYKKPEIKGFTYLGKMFYKDFLEGPVNLYRRIRKSINSFVYGIYFEMIGKRLLWLRKVVGLDKSEIIKVLKNTNLHFKLFYLNEEGFLFEREIFLKILILIRRFILLYTFTFLERVLKIEYILVLI